MTAELTIDVSGEASGSRLDAFLTRTDLAGQRSRSEWQKLIERGYVSVNGRPAKPGQRLTEGEKITVRPAPSGAVELTPDTSIRFTVVYEDPAMAVLDKPAGVVVHPAPGHEAGTLVNGLLARYPELRETREGQPRPGIVHRLDKDTSGLLVVGRTASATVDLQRQIAAREVEKLYLLLVVGSIGEDEGQVEAPIRRDVRDRQRMQVHPEGRPSYTSFRVRERFGDYTFLEALLLTGRTHQLRVHFAAIGHPVAGDERYGSGRGPRGLARQFVHSHRLTLHSPEDGLERTFTAPLPQDLAEPLAWLKRRGQRRA